ncbi:MAG: hypothetical protein ACYCV7_09160 [Acidimicrobiales bacterium]
MKFPQLASSVSGSSMRKMALLAAATVWTVTLLGVSSIVLASRQASNLVNKRIQAATSVRWPSAGKPAPW